MADQQDEQTSYHGQVWGTIGAAALGVLLLFSVRCPLGPETARTYAARSLPPEPQPVLLPPPPVDEEYFPCTDCHEGETPNRTVRTLEEEHDTLEFAHGNLWCLHCHPGGDQSDQLRLADGSYVEFVESWRLCTQCHAHKLEEWRVGVHGKRTGSWWGRKEFRTCVACHDPHSPRFEPLEPKRPPVPPEEIVLRAGLMPAEEPDDER